jgi:NAD(P)-dependent dehydrogenase (short-subunit alcohol dehydrogenase family)
MNDKFVFNPLNLSGCRYIVTGASSGIGRAVAILLSRLGAQLVCVGRNQERLTDTIDLLEGKENLSSCFDLQDIDAIPGWMETLAKKGGQLNGFVHAAGIQSITPIKFVTHEKWQAIFKINTEAGFVLAKSFMRKNIYAGKNGSIVYISSVMGHVGTAGRVVYSASKGAIEGMVRSLAMECAPNKVRVNCIAPAFVRTQMFDEMARIWGEQQQADVLSRHPLGIGEPEDVANAVAFLLADTGRWITGTVLAVDGGYTAQ